MRISILLAAAAFAAIPAAAQNADTANVTADPATNAANAVATDPANAADPANTAAVPPVDPVATVAVNESPAVGAETPAVVTPDDDGFPWGIIGLVGLVGLLGRRRTPE